MLRKAILVVFMAGLCLAQAPGGGISGTVTDQRGAAVGKADITITSLETGFERTLNISEDGSYTVLTLPAGAYEVKIEARGFRSMSRRAIVEVGTTTTVNLELELGSVSDVVNVADATPQMKYEQHQVGGVVTRDQILNLPLNGRNFLVSPSWSPASRMRSEATTTRSSSLCWAPALTSRHGSATRGSHRRGFVGHHSLNPQRPAARP